MQKWMRKIRGRRCYAGIMAGLLFGMIFLPYLNLPGKAYGSVSFGEGELSYSEELVALWDGLAAAENMERTDFIGHMTCTFPIAGVVIYKQQTSVSPGGKWKDYEYRNMYCISHSRELAENPNTTMETSAIWYMKKEPYTLRNLPDSITSRITDQYRRRFNFLLMAYGANYEAYQGGVNSDPVIGTANYYLCQSFCTLSEEAKFTGDRAHDWGMYRQHATQIANLYNPSKLGSNQVYLDMMENMETTFNAVWNTAKVAADCVESSDTGYVFHPSIALEGDGMYHARYVLTPETKEFFGSSSITLHGDWSFEVTENAIDFRSPTGRLSDDGYAAEIDLANANGIIRKMIGNESVREVHMPVKIGNCWSLTFAQGNLISNLIEGMKIIVGSPEAGSPPLSAAPHPASSAVVRYKHTEKWQADYVVNLRKMDAETKEPLEGAWFDILEAFDDSQLEGSILEDDNWDNDNGSQFMRWKGWDSPYGENGDGDPCEKDQQVTDSEGWLVEADSLGAGELQPSGVHAHRDTKYYSYTKGYCGGHPEPEEDDEEDDGGEASEEYERQIEICESLAAAGGFYHSLDGGARELLEADRNRHYEEFVSLAYEYSARETAARNGYILHNQDQVHEPFENVFDGIHQDTVPVETVTVHSSQYYALQGGESREKRKEKNRIEEITLTEDGFIQEEDDLDRETVDVNQEIPYLTAESRYFMAVAGSNDAIKTEVIPGEEADLDHVWILDEDGTCEEDSEYGMEDEWDTSPYAASPSNAGSLKASPANASCPDADPSDFRLPVRTLLLPGGIRSSGTGGNGMRMQQRRKKTARDNSVRSSAEMQESPIAHISPADPDYSESGGTDWVFEIYDNRTEAEVHINKRDLLLKRGENENYNSYGDTQGDGCLEGAVYGLYAAEDIIHPDGKTGVVFEKGNLVAITSTDKNGDASFMAITEAPGTVYDYSQGRTVRTGFAGPGNAYTANIHMNTSNPDSSQGERWYYPLTDNQSDNGNCWIGRPLLLGSYYIQELTRSEGYELSVYGIDADISNRNSWLAGGSPEAKGNVQVKKVEGNVRLMEDTQKKETVTEIHLYGSGADYGYDISVKNISPEAHPGFWLTTLGKKEVYREWKEPEIYYGTVEAAYGTPVMIDGKTVEAEEGEVKTLPNGENVIIGHTMKMAVSPENVVITGQKGAIRTLDNQYIPELTGIAGGNEAAFINNCNQAFSSIGLQVPDRDAPYFLVELGDDALWARNLYAFLAREDCPAFNGARLEKVIRKNGKPYGMLRYSFLEDGKGMPVVFSTPDQTFYVRYPVVYSDGSDGYIYRGYPLSGLTEENYERGVYLYRWIRVPNMKPENQVGLYEDLSRISYVSAQEFRSLWVYGEGELLRAQDGSIYQKEYTRYVDRSGYQMIETAVYEEIEAVYDPVSRTWKLHGTPEQISPDGSMMITVRYGNRFGGETKSITVAAAPSMNLTGTYVQPVILAYPGQDSVYEDAGTRQVPVEVSERAVIQKLQVRKDIEKTSYNNTNSYGKIHEDWFTRIFGGYYQNGDAKAAAGKMDNFRFKTYLKSNLARLYRWEDGQVVWQDRMGREMDETEVLGENNRFPELVRKIHTKVLHQTEPLFQDSEMAVVANERLYEYANDKIKEEPEKGYTAILETTWRTAEDKEGIRVVKAYNYEKFFDAIQVANHDKWDDRAPSYTSWHPIGNQANRTEEAIENARASDQVRQFAIDWYLQDEVKKLAEPVQDSPGETQAAKGQVSYPDEIYDRALQAAILKSENYLKPFFLYDLDEIYAVLWDGEEGGGSDKDASTLSADMIYEEDGGYYGISAYLPYGTYVVVEQQPKYSGSEYGKNLMDFKNKHYEVDKPKEISLPSLYAGYDGFQASPELMNKYYCYDGTMAQSEMERKYHIRFHEEDHVIQAHNHHGDFEIYKYGMDIRLIDNGVPEALGRGNYFSLTQDSHKPYKNYYNKSDDRKMGDVDFYLTENQSGRKGIAPNYRYSSVSEHKGTADDVPYPGGTSTEDNVPGAEYKDQVSTIHGVQTTYDGLYAPMLVPWSVVAPELSGGGLQSGGQDEKTGESDYLGLASLKFRNRFFTARLRLEKLDSETHENILHDSAIFAVYAAKRDDSRDGNGQVLFYDKDTTIVGTKEFLESMGAVHICPVARRISFLDRFLGKETGPGNLYTGVVPAGTPICDEAEKIITGKGQGQQTVAFSSYSTVLDGKMKDEEGKDKMRWQFQTVGYLETPQPLGAGVYVICEEKAPSGYVRTKPVAVEVYSDKVVYYKEGHRDSRVLAAIYEELSEETTGNRNKPQDKGNMARIHIENTPIKLTVEKLKESSSITANTTADKTVTYKVSGRIDGSLADIGNNPDYIYAYENGHYLGYGWKKGTLEYLAARKAAGEQVEFVYEGAVFAGYGYVTRALETADDKNSYVAGAKMALFDALVLNPSGDNQDYAFEGLAIERNSTNNITRMYVKKGYAGEKTDFVKRKDENGQEYEGEFQAGADRYGNPVIKKGNIWGAVVLERPDTDILYYDLDSLEIVASKIIDGRRIIFGYDRDHRMIPISQIESDKANFRRTDTDHSLFAFKGGMPYLELAGGDFTKIQYSSMDKTLAVGEGTLVYHLDREGNRDSLVDPYTGMAYVPMPGESSGKVMVWPVNLHRDQYGNVIARDKIITCRVATIGENQDGYEEKAVLDVVNHSGREILRNRLPSYEHKESGSVSGTWESQESGESHRETTVYTNPYGQNLNGEVLADDNNGSFAGELNPVYDSYGLSKYYQRSNETYDKGTELYDRNGDFVRYQDSDNLEEYNKNAYHINSYEQIYDGDKEKEKQEQKKLYHRQGEGYILENIWITSDKTPNDPFHNAETNGQADILKRVPAGNYIMEEIKSPPGYLKGMPEGVVVLESTDMQHTSMVDKTTKVEISKIDGTISRKIGICHYRSDGAAENLGSMTERSGGYTYSMVPGARLALFEARKVYDAQKPKGYYLEKTGKNPLIYDSTDSQAGDQKKLTACWVTESTPVYAEGIPAGTYILEEIYTPPGFVAGRPVEVEIVNTPQVQIFVMNNDHTKVEIEKYSIQEDKKSRISGAGFTLYEAITDKDGKAILCEGDPIYDPGKAIDSWITSDLKEYTSFIPAFEVMYQEHGAKEKATVQWGEDGQEYKAECIFSCSPDIQDNGQVRLHPVTAELIFEMEDGRQIRITVWGGDYFEYQFDYRKLPEVNEYACSYVTLDGVRRIDYLPAGNSYVLVETKVPRGYAKAKDRLICVSDTEAVQRYSVENTEGKLYVSKRAKGRTKELAGAHLELYRAEDDGSLMKDKNHLEAEWITGSDGVYTDSDYVNDRILSGYETGDLKPHKIERLENGIYWLTERKCPDYYTTFEPIRIDYRQEDEIQVIRAENSLVEGCLEIKKTGADGTGLKGAVFELAAYGQRDLRNPVFTKKLSDTNGRIQIGRLPVGEVEKDGKVVPYQYKLKEIVPPEGYAVNTQIFTWRFEPDKEGEPYAFHEEAVRYFEIVDERTKVFIGKKDFDALGAGTEGDFLSGAEFAVYEITGRDLEGGLLYDKESPLDRWTTRKEEVHEIEGLIAGRSYLLKELSSPTGYHLMEPVLFVMSMDGRRIIKISNEVNTVTVHGMEGDGEDPDPIYGITIKGRYPTRVEYEMADRSGMVKAHWTGTKDGHILDRKDGWKDGEIYTITEYTCYHDGTRPVTGKRTESLFFDEDGFCCIPGREARNTSLTLSHEDGTKIESFLVNEILSEKTIKNNVLPENPQIMISNRDGKPGQVLDPAQAIIGTIAFINDSAGKTDMEIAVSLDSSLEILDSGGGMIRENQIIYKEKDVMPMERRTVSYVAAAEKEALSVHQTAVARYQGHVAATSKTVPFMQKGRLIIYNELTGTGKGIFGGEESEFQIRLYAEDGEELKGRYQYGGSRTGIIQSGDHIVLAGNEFAVIDPGFYKNARYQIARKEDGKEVTGQNLSGTIGEQGAFASFTRQVWDSSNRELFRKGGSYLLTEQTVYSDKTTWENGRFVFTLDGQAAIRGVVVADKKTKIVFSKSDITGTQEISGCHMRIKDREGNEILSWVSTEEPYKIEGILTPGEEYYLEEIRPEDGYAFAEEIRFAVSENGISEQVAMKDEDTKLRIHKFADSDGTKYVPDAILQILNQDKTPARAVCSLGAFKEGELLIFRSGEESTEIIRQLCAGQSYWLHEIKPPSGCAYAEDVPFVISPDGSWDEVVMTDRQTHVSVSKTGITGEKEIPGNHLRIKTTEGDEVISWVSGTKPYEIQGILDAGETYILEELQPWDGYAWAEEIRFKVSLDGTVDRVVMKNQRTQAEILKTDARSKEPVAGAVLQIQDKEGRILEQWTSGVKSHRITGKLAAGEVYYLCEKKAPKGYLQSEKMEFTMPKKPELLQISYENKKRKGGRIPDGPETPKEREAARVPEEPKEPGRITAVYESETPGWVKEFFDNRIPKAFRLPETGDKSLAKWYLIGVAASFLGMCIAFFAISMTKCRRFDIINRIRKKKEKNAEKDKER